MNDYEAKSVCDPQRPTLTEIQDQTEKQLIGMGELLDALECKISGPMPCADTGSCNGLSARPGLYDQASHNLARVNDLACSLSRIVNKL